PALPSLHLRDSEVVIGLGPAVTAVVGGAPDRWNFRSPFRRVQGSRRRGHAPAKAEPDSDDHPGNGDARGAGAVCLLTHGFSFLAGKAFPGGGSAAGRGRASRSFVSSRGGPPARMGSGNVVAMASTACRSSGLSVDLGRGRVGRASTPLREGSVPSVSFR